MKIWTAMKRLNQRYDAWAMRTAKRVVAGLDRRYEDDKKPEARRHLSVWDLLPRKRETGR